MNRAFPGRLPPQPLEGAPLLIPPGRPRPEHASAPWSTPKSPETSPTGGQPKGLCHPGPGGHAGPPAITQLERHTRCSSCRPPFGAVSMRATPPSQRSRVAGSTSPWSPPHHHQVVGTCKGGIGSRSEEWTAAPVPGSSGRQGYQSQVVVRSSGARLLRRHIVLWTGASVGMKFWSRGL